MVNRLCETLLGKAPDKLERLPLGLNNHNYRLTLEGCRYVLRLPQNVQNRQQEGRILQALAPLDFVERVCHFDLETGVKLSEYIPNAQPCDPAQDAEVLRCFSVLHRVHTQQIPNLAPLNLAGHLQDWEAQYLPDAPYQKDKNSLLSAYDAYRKESKTSLVHCDAHKDNFLLTAGETYLVDWEFASRADPDLDFASFIVYDYLPPKRVEHLMDLYLQSETSPQRRNKLRTYIRLLALFWYSWASSLHQPSLIPFRQTMCAYLDAYR